MKRIAFLAILYPLCTLAGDRELYVELTDHVPEVGVETVAYLGDRMLVQRTGQWAECITPNQTFYGRSSGSTSIYLANEPLCKRQSRDKHYWGNYDNFRGIMRIVHAPVTLTETKKGLKMCLRRSMCVKNIDESDVLVDETFIHSEDTFQQFIEYSGMSDDVLSFTHSEFEVDLVGDTFPKEFTLDLSDGNVLDYNGAIIEIIEATNTDIRYKVVRNFRD